MEITAVLCSRNDSKDNLRFVRTIQNLIELYDEIIYVDYGSDEITLTERYKDSFKALGKFRTIVVPKEFCEIIHPFKKNLFIEVAARNIGIRRATRDWVVSTNQDIICQRPIVLDDNTMYTVARRNVPLNLAEKFCNSSNTIEFLLKIKEHFSVQPDCVDSNGNPTWDSGDKWSLVVSCGDYQIASRKVWNTIRGFEDSLIHRSYADSNVMRKAANNGFSIKKLDLDVFHLDHPINESSNYKHNSRIECVNTFISNTDNSDNWGYSDMVFREIVI